MFQSYKLQSGMFPSGRGTPDWLVDLERQSFTVEIHENDHAPVLTGDPNDGIPLQVTSIRWGMPNLWMMRKGLDPFDGPVFSMSLSQALTAYSGQIRTPSWRCLVPVTSIALDISGNENDVHDPNCSLLTLAGLICGVESEASYIRGFCFLTSEVHDSEETYDAPLVVAPEHHNSWMCGWGGNKLRSCCEPLLGSRLAEV